MFHHWQLGRSPASAFVAQAPAPMASLAPPLEQLRHLAVELRLLLPRVRVGEARATTEEFNREVFWRRLNEAAVKVSREATALTTVFSQLPLPSPQETQRFCEQVHAAIKAIIAVYYSLPKDQALRTMTLFPATVSGLRASRCLGYQEITKLQPF
uniref:Cyclin-D1-binding protein 1 n=1 Tax=Propithecus coquereli TaxID=379532 RepID=A0A2K6FPE4_PROCO